MDAASPHSALHIETPHLTPVPIPAEYCAGLEGRYHGAWACFSVISYSSGVCPGPGPAQVLQMLVLYLIGGCLSSEGTQTLPPHHFCLTQMLHAIIPTPASWPPHCWPSNSEECTSQGRGWPIFAMFASLPEPHSCSPNDCSWPLFPLDLPLLRHCVPGGQSLYLVDRAPMLTLHRGPPMVPRSLEACYTLAWEVVTWVSREASIHQLSPETA